ncbi:MAG: helix-turn-helix domain-containing protein [Lachnospiraceae bacterium]|nr:helix-turn-helix domain-containing protein [Lachnospiraceae bacterium]
MENQNKSVVNNYKEIYEHVNSDYPLAVYFVKPDEYFLNKIHWHWHEEIEIDIVREGNAIYTIGEDIIKVPCGNAIIIKSNVFHSIESEGEDCSIISIIFSPSILFSDSISAMSLTYFKPFLNMHDKAKFINPSDRVGKVLFSYIEDIIDYNLNREYGYELLTKSVLYQFWFLLVKDIPHKEYSRKSVVNVNKISADEERIKDAITFIQDNYPENISLDDIASSIHISKSECCRLFKRTISLTPFEYLTRYRILQACDIMIKSQRNDESISYLAGSVGFNSASYFNKLFKEYVGCTPTEFRKKSKTERRDKLSPFGMSFSHI